MNQAALHRCVSIAGFIFLLGLPFKAEARRIFPLTTDELTARAPIVCNGTVIGLQNTLEKGTRALPGYEKNFTVPVEYWSATIRILATFKGQVPPEIEVRFPQIDQHPVDNKSTIICDGPLLISLQPQKRYRFYLKPVPGQNWYVGICDGDFDDSYAIQPLEDKEPDDSTPFPRAEALKQATDYVRLYKPDDKVSDWSIEATEFGFTRWTVTFWWLPAHGNDFDPCAEIEILGNRQLDPRSWVSDRSRLSVHDLKPADLGQEFRVYLNMGLTDSFYNSSNLRGHLKSIASDKIELSDAQSTDWQPKKWPTLAVPVKDIRELQHLIPPGPPYPAPSP